MTVNGPTLGRLPRRDQVRSWRDIQISLFNREEDGFLLAHFYRGLITSTILIEP
jgi:hypothetical protein